LLCDDDIAAQVREYAFALEVANALEVISDYDIMVDASDNVATWYLISDACVVANKPPSAMEMWKIAEEHALEMLPVLGLELPGANCHKMKHKSLGFQEPTANILLDDST
jgi:hypothetical protein